MRSPSGAEILTDINYAYVLYGFACHLPANFWLNQKQKCAKSSLPQVWQHKGAGEINTSRWVRLKMTAGKTQSNSLYRIKVVQAISRFNFEELRLSPPL